MQAQINYRQNILSIRYNAGYNVEIVAVKTAKGYWKKI